MPAMHKRKKMPHKRMRHGGIRRILGNERMPKGSARQEAGWHMFYTPPCQGEAQQAQGRWQEKEVLKEQVE